MAFGICRARNLKMGDLSSTDKHNSRLYESKEDYPPNIDPEKHFSSRYLFENEEDYSYPGEATLQEAIQRRLDINNVKGMRKNSNVAIEYVLAVNDQTAWDNYSPAAFFQSASEWVEKRHGKGSVVAVAEHYDESNPHMHIIVVPLVTKDVHWKNKRGEGLKKETRIDTRSYTGGREKLRQLQTDYHQFCVGFQSKLGITFHRGTFVENQTREYVKQTDYRIGRVRQIIAQYSKDFPHLIEEVRKSIESRLKRLKTLFQSLRIQKNVLESELQQEIKMKRDRGAKGKWAERGPHGDQLNSPIKETPKENPQRIEKAP